MEFSSILEIYERPPSAQSISQSCSLLCKPLSPCSPACTHRHTQRPRHTHTHTCRLIHTETHIDPDTQKQTETHRDSDTQKHTKTHTDTQIQIYTHRNMQTQRQTDRHTHTHTLLFLSISGTSLPSPCSLPPLTSSLVCLLPLEHLLQRIRWPPVPEMSTRPSKHFPSTWLLVIRRHVTESPWFTEIA